MSLFVIPKSKKKKKKKKRKKNVEMIGPGSLRLCKIFKKASYQNVTDMNMIHSKDILTIPCQRLLLSYRIVPGIRHFKIMELVV